MLSLLSDALISVYLQLPEECRAWHQHERTSPDPALQAKTSLCFSRQPRLSVANHVNHLR